MIIFVLTISVSRMSIRIKQLAQELALYEKNVKRITQMIQVGRVK